ncbi:ATP-dependent RNA helicase DDX54-like isoform X2 [Tigriopus californicus]|uniref:ATP-dependent RNA helicase DDX54-like isoform X2 n=1 Tax=Tigriopus californicus TaxID=6832 RepID=UPI0027DA3C13|nr:ATP-dependent RNA helicase DDX54-like isoform X2 [Tigriopus californicus]
MERSKHGQHVRRLGAIEGTTFNSIWIDLKTRPILDRHSPGIMTSAPDQDEVANAEEGRRFQALIAQQNKKKKKSGGFQSMGLDHEIFRGIMKKGYRVPTPIQRKSIPVILEGRDAVAMARTGSGKTAAFLIPLFQKLKSRSAKVGARALILSPTKELALQTLKFTRDLGRFSGLRSVCILGGESMEKQFAQMHENPDIIIATPGRLVHLSVEMSLKLTSIEYVVFDEADRLFEMGFGEQLTEILARLPENRQTLLFSATLPKLLLEFTKAGLSDPVLIRLDADTKIPDTLKMGFFSCRSEGKPAILLHLFRQIIHPSEQTVIFASTRHHVEYLHALLDRANISNTYMHSHLDPTARKINTAKFQARKSNVLIVTDVAARGIDIPLLDNVINYNFPSRAKLFVHRVGRVARAGRMGTAYSLVAGDEFAYFIDLQLFLGNDVNTFPLDVKADAEWHNYLGVVPQCIYDDCADQLQDWHEDKSELSDLKGVASNGYKHYLKSRPGASNESIRRAKRMKTMKFGPHPLFISTLKDQGELQKTKFLAAMKRYRPQNTIFEIGATTKSSQVQNVMTKKRKIHGNTISKFRTKNDGDEKEANEEQDQQLSDIEDDDDQDNGEHATKEDAALEEPSQIDIDATFKRIVQPKPFKAPKVFQAKKKKPKEVKNKKDDENYISYQAKDHHQEAGYSLLSNNFDNQAAGAVLDLTGDDDASMRAKKNAMRWDNKKKKYVRADVNDKKKIKTESGVWIQASYKSDRYAKWKERSKLSFIDEPGQSGGHTDDDYRGGPKMNRKRQMGGGLPEDHPAMKKARDSVPKHRKGPKNEIQRPEQILKKRKLDEKKRAKNAKKGKKGKGRKGRR